MRKFLVKILMLALIVIILDNIIGYAMSTAFDQIRVGGRGRDNYICNTAIEDILVFGSSRAVHHYNSTILEDSIGISCYNCGDDGCGIILSYGRLMMAKERHQPKIVIEDVNPDYDLLEGDNTKYLGWLKSRYNRPGIKDIFDEIDKTSRYKMLCQMYRHNSTFLQFLFASIFSVSNDAGVKGFRPLKSKLNPMKVKTTTTIKADNYEFDPIKLKFIGKFIDLTKGSKLVFVVSPLWYGMDPNKVAPIREICQERDIPFIDFSNNLKYVHNNEYFKDGTHLNALGADEFTKDLIIELRKQDVL